MSYCLAYRESVLDFCNRHVNGVRKASRVFGISTNTITRWKHWKASNNLEGQTVRPQRKLALKALKDLLDSKPDLLQREMAEYFGVHIATINNGLKKIGYKRKKKQLYTKKGANKRGRYILAK